MDVEIAQPETVVAVAVEPPPPSRTESVEPAEPVAEPAAAAAASPPDSPPPVAPKFPRKRVLTDSDDDDVQHNADVREAVASMVAARDAASAVHAGREHKRKKKHHKKHKKHKKKKSRLTKMQKSSDSEKEDGNKASAAGDDASSGAASDSDAAAGSGSDDEDSGAGGAISSEEIRDLNAGKESVDRPSVTGAAASSDDEEFDAAPRPVAGVAAAVDALNGGGAAVPDPPVTRPDDDDEFEAFVKPIMVIEKRSKVRPGVMLVAILCYVVEVEPESFASNIVEKTGDASRPMVNRMLEEHRDSQHSCDSANFFMDVSMEFNDSFKEDDVTEWRRSPALRPAKPRRAWLMCTMRQENGIGDATEYECAIGAYRLILRAVTTEVCGITGGDLAAAACTKLTEPTAIHASEARGIAKFSALCLTRKELLRSEFRPADLRKLLLRKESAAGEEFTTAALTCFGSGLPLELCKFATLMCESVNPRSDKKVCEFLSPQWASETTNLKVLPDSQSTRPALASVVIEQKLYRQSEIKATMRGSYFHRAFYKFSEAGKSTLLMKCLSGGDKARGPCMQWHKCPELAAFCGCENSGQAYLDRLNDAVSSSMRVANPVTVNIDRNPELLPALINRAHTKLYSPVDAVTDSEQRAILNVFIDWFGDLFLDTQPAAELCSRALGIGIGRALKATNLAERVASFLQSQAAPYVLFFDVASAPTTRSAAREVIEAAIRVSFMRWMRTVRKTAYEYVLSKCKNNEAAATQVLVSMFRATERLAIARRTGERCAFIESAHATDAGENPLARYSPVELADMYTVVVNVDSSPVRVVRGEESRSLIVVDAADYATETALRYLLLSASTHMKLGAVEDRASADRPVTEADESPYTERLVLLRGASADDMEELLSTELRGEAEYVPKGGKPVFGSSILFIVQEKTDTAQVSAFVRTLADARLVRVVSVEEFCSTGSAGIAATNEAGETKRHSWAQLYTVIVFYAAHRYSYETMLRCVAVLCGVDDVPAVPSRMSLKERETWSAQFTRKNAHFPTALDVQAVYDERVDDARKFYTKLVETAAIQKLEADHPERLWGKLSGNVSGARARFVFAYVAYARPTQRGSLELTACGNFCEDLYFSNADPSVVKVCEAYGGGTAGQLLLKYWEERRVMFFDDSTHVTDEERGGNVQKRLVELYREGMRVNCPEVVAHTERSVLGYERRLAKAIDRGAVQARLNVPSTANSLGAVVSGWNTNRERPMPEYTPQPLDARRYETAAKEVLFSVQAMTHAFAHSQATDALARFHCVYVPCAYRANLLHMYERAHQSYGDRRERGSDCQVMTPLEMHWLAADAASVGRAVIGELMARLRNDFVAFILFADSARNVLQQALIPSACRASQPVYMQDALDATRTLRRDLSLEAENDVLRRVSLAPHTPALRGRNEFPYFHCLQSASTYLWRVQVYEAVVAYNKLFSGDLSDEDAERQEIALATGEFSLPVPEPPGGSAPPPPEQPSPPAAEVDETLIEELMQD